MSLFGGIAASLAGGLLGGIGGGKEDAAELKPWDEAAPYAEDIMGQAQGLYNQGAMNPLQMMGLQNQLGFAEMYAPSMLNAAMSGWGSMLNPWAQGPMNDAWGAARWMAQGGINPYGEQLMRDSANNMTQSFREGVLPQIAGNAIGAGAFGGSRQAINESLASQRFNQSLGQQQNQLASSLYGQGLGQQQAGVNALSNIAGTGLQSIGSGVSGLNSLLGAGMFPGQTQYNVGQTYQNAPWEALSQYNAMVSPYGSVGSVAQQPNMMSRVGGDLIGLGGGLLAQHFFGGM